MRKSVLVLAALIVVASCWALSPNDLIKGIDDQLLQGYVQPLVNSFGTAMGTGLFHSARAHGLLGFDVGLNVMAFQVPSADKFFSGEVRCCSVSTSNGSLNYFNVHTDSLPTIFGQSGIDSLQTRLHLPANAVAIPPVWPGGLNVPGTLFLMPQLSLGLVGGLELMARGLPWTYRGDNFTFYGVGLKWNPTNLPVLNKFPIDFAVQGAYQKFTLGSALNSTTWNVNGELSKKILFATIYGGAGYEHTGVDISYRFNYKLPAWDAEHGFYTVACLQGHQLQCSRQQPLPLSRRPDHPLPARHGLCRLQRRRELQGDQRRRRSLAPLSLSPRSR